MERITNHNRLIVIFLALTFPFVWAPNQHNPTGMLPTDRTLKPTLCGKLVFIDDIKTGAKLIGLIPCGESRPYVFSRRPGELHNFYRFQDVVIEKDKNMSISTANYGVLYTFIMKFNDYVPIQSCSECKGFTPTATTDITEPVIDCNTWILEESAAQFLNVINGSDINKIKADLEDNTYVSQTQNECNSNVDCLQQKIAFRLGNELGELFHQRSVVLQKVIIFLKNLLAKPESMQACPSIDKMVWYLAIGLNQRGYAIELLEVTSPAIPFLMDVQGRQTGIQEDGSVVEEIPDSSVAVTSWGIYVLLPSGNPISIQVQGTSFGSVVLSTLHNHEAEIQNISFEGLLFTKSTRGSLDFIDSQPVLKIDMLNNGNLEARNPDFYEEYPVLDVWQITPIATGTGISASPSIIPTPVSIQTATALLLPSSESTHTPTTTPADRPHTPSLCPNLYALAVLPIVAWCQRKLFASRRSQS